MSPTAAHWAVVLKSIVAHRAPSASSPAVATLDTMTGDGTQNIVLILKAAELSKKVTWYQVRLPILPNNSTGWVPRSALGQLYTVNTHLYVDRETDTLVLKKNGVPIFTTRVGTGHSYWPTPAGQFYIRDKLTDFNDPFYGPVAFGTSARSAVLTDWPGGGYIGVHGTNEPQLLPGHVSHGCIRLQNSAILKLAKMMPVGTPLTVT
jgi:lipoprotein-anchoring transpeptidase ErfK/SrfK